MPIRPAQWTDIPVMARVKAASFSPDRLFEVIFRHKDEYPDDMVTAFRRSIRVSWWDYSKVLMVSYEEIKADEIEPQTHDLTITRHGRREVITGMSEWQRVGLGWNSVWNIWGWWDPRCLVQNIFKLYNKIAYFIRPCRASAKPSKEDPSPLLYSNFHARIGPFCDRLLSNPLMPWRKNHWSLEILCIHPLFQGKGHGKELTEWGLAKAKCDTASGVTGLPAVVIAAEKKEQFYQRLGFQELVGWSSRSVEGSPDVNPLEERGVSGGAVLWTWVKEDKEAVKQKIMKLENA